MKPIRDELRRAAAPEAVDEMSQDELEGVAGGYKTSDRISAKLRIPPYVYVTKPKFPIPVPDPEPGW